MKLGILVSVVALVLTAAPAEAVTKFKNCTAVNKVYRHGIAKSAAAARTASGLTGSPKISLALYTANKGSDRDKDGVACEK